MTSTDQKVFKGWKNLSIHWFTSYSRLLNLWYVELHSANFLWGPERYCWKKALGAKQEHKPHADQSSSLLKSIVMIIEEKTLPRKIVFPTAVHCNALARARGRGCEILFLATWRPTCCKQPLALLHRPVTKEATIKLMSDNLHDCDVFLPATWRSRKSYIYFTVSLILFSISLNCYPSKGWKLFIWWAQLNTNGHNQTMAATVKQAAWSN